jgi:hypothetical protein
MKNEIENNYSPEYRQQRAVIWEMQFWDEVKEDMHREGVRL